MIRLAGVAAWLIGIAACIGLTIWSGPYAVGHAVATVGWGIPLVIAMRAVTVAMAGIGWWLVFPLQLRPRLVTCVLLRFIREAGNVLLPLGQVGGDLIGAALLTFRGVAGPLAAASVIVDILIQAATQFLFALLGLLVLLALEADETLARIAAVGLVVAGLMLAGFYLAQGHIGQRALRWIGSRLAGDRNWRVLGTIDAVYRNLAMIYAARSRLLASAAVHMGAWLVGVTEVMIVLAFMGSPIGLAQALVIESLLHAIRGAAFAVPGALGAQEGGLVLLCAVFGIPPEQAIALSFARRTADLALGVPGLLGWQVLEWGRLKPVFSLAARRPHAPAHPSSGER
jgi:putative membrane protein